MNYENSINAVIDGISAAIDEAFGGDCLIFDEELPQNHETPCFFITPLTASNNRFLGSRFLKKHSFCIYYFPNDDIHTRRECNETAEQLYTALEVITAGGDLIRGNNLSHQVQDGILNFFVNYDFFVREVKDETKMRNVTRRVKPKR